MTGQAEFVHLHLHTEFSLLDGACHIDELVDQAARFGMKSLAITDHGNMFGAVHFHDACRDKGLKPILGCEVYVATGSRLDKNASVITEAYNHLLQKHHQGIVALSGCLSSEIGTALRAGNEAAALSAIGEFSDVFSGGR